MGIIFDLLSELDDMDPALEAEDITDEVEAGTNNINGKKNADGGDEALAGASDNSDGEIDTNTDDILGTSDNNDDSDTSEDGEYTSDENNEDSENTDDSMSDDESIKNSMEENDNSFESVRKKKMHKQLLAFYETLNDDIKIVNEYVPRASDDNTIKALTCINNNLVQCKDYTYRILTEEFKTTDYPVLLKKYVAMNRVYDLCIRALQTYFDAKRKEDDKK